VLETKQRGLHVIVQPEFSMPERLDELVARMETVRQRLVPLVGDGRQLWLGVPIDKSNLSTFPTAVRAALSTQAGQAGSHVLLMNGSAIP
jgi:hypothetical protein